MKKIKTMVLNDIHAETSFDLWMKTQVSDSIPQKGLGFLSLNNGRESYNFKINNKLLKIDLRDKVKRKELNFHLQRGCAHLAEIVQLAKNGTFLLKIIFFYGEMLEMGDVEIGINERIEQAAKRNSFRFRDTEALGFMLSEKCRIKVDQDEYFIMMSGPSAYKDFEPQNNNPKEDEAFENQITVAEKFRQFSIYGDRLRIPVEQRALDNTEEIFFATKAIFSEHTKPERALRLVKGTLSFSDYTKTGRIRALAAGTMSRLTKSSGSYLKQWDEYGAIEGEILLARAKAIGKIEYTGTQKTTKGVKFFVSSVPEELNEGDDLEITTEIPVYISDPTVGWNEYSQSITKKDNTNQKSNVQNTQTRAQLQGTILKISPTSIELELPQIPSGKGFLVMSIGGNETQIKRRMKARTALLEGRSANPLLGLIIEEDGVLPDIQKTTKIKPLTPFVKNKIFKHPPTDMQIKAIKIALNTPDIAIIQGPPGTGKTTVVTAILERLNEEFDKTKSIRGQILVSGFQHDAVENIVSRLSVNALPAVKFGRRSGDSEFTEDAVTAKLYKWCSDVAEQIREKNPQLAQTEEQVRLAELFTAYSLCPSKNNTVNLIKRILLLPRDLLTKELELEAREILESLKSQQKPKDKSTLRLIRALRVRQASFKDDGAEQAINLLNKIEDDLSKNELKTLELASRWRKTKPLDFLPTLLELKKVLLERYLPIPDFNTEKPREDVLRLFVKTSEMLKTKLTTTNKRDAILAEFLHELEDNPDGVREAVEDYNFIYAATTQQSMGKQMAHKEKCRGATGAQIVHK